MRLTRLTIDGLRCLRQVELVPSIGMNLLLGGNGAGKTSVLEALFMLGSGRSFRFGGHDAVIAHGAKALQLFAELEHGGRAERVGFERSRVGWRGLRNGEKVADLAELGVGAAMISGDTPAAAGAVAAGLGIAQVHAGVLPEGKLELVRRIGGAFVGDGINDAPALAAAEVGIAMGTGTDVAIEAGDVVLMRGDPRAVVSAIRLSRAVMRNIRQNLAWAFGYNIALIPVAAGVLVPFGGPQISPMLGAGAMALSSVFVLTNALRLKGVQ